jgi:hypothetical protein
MRVFRRAGPVRSAGKLPCETDDLHLSTLVKGRECAHDDKQCRSCGNLHALNDVDGFYIPVVHCSGQELPRVSDEVTLRYEWRLGFHCAAPFGIPAADAHGNVLF